MKRAEIGESDRMGDDQPAAAVGDLEAIDRLGNVAVLAAGTSRTTPRIDDLVAGAIRGAVGVDIGARGQPWAT